MPARKPPEGKREEVAGNYDPKMKRDTQQKLESIASIVKTVDLSIAAVFYIVVLIAFLGFIGYGVYLAAHNLRF